MITPHYLSLKGEPLSKAYGLIQRFSEDIDLALLSSGLSGNQAKSRIDKLSKEITQHLTEVNVQGLTKKWSRFRKTFHQYPAVIPEVPGTQMAPFLLLELNSFGVPYPYQTMAISSLIADFLRFKNRVDLVNKYHLQPATIQVLKPERTLCEKVLALARASYHAEPIQQLQNKIRHVYDLHILMSPSNLGGFVASPQLDDLLRLVQQDDAGSREFQGAWNAHPLSNALIFQEDNELWLSLEKTYATSFAAMVYGPLPPIQSVRESMSALKRRLSTYDKAPNILS